MKKRITVLLILSLLLSGCAAQTTEAPAMSLMELDNLQTIPPEERLTLSDLDLSEQPGEDCERIVLEQCRGPLVLEKGGEYLLMGTLVGQVILTGEEEEQFHLFLQHATIIPGHGPAIYARNPSKVVVTVLEGDDSWFSCAETRWKGETAAGIYTPGELTLNGLGKLKVDAPLGDGIRCGGVLRLHDLTLELTAARDGLRGNNGILLENCGLTLETGENGLLTELYGNMILKNVALRIDAGAYGLWSGSRIFGSGVDCSITAGIAEGLGF